MNCLPLEIIYLIFENLYFLDKIKLKKVCKLFNTLLIRDFLHITFTLQQKLDDNILADKWYITKLFANDNPKIKNIRHMTNLKILDCGSDCGISDEDIKNLNLTELYALDNPKIKSIHHMTNLKMLDCGLNCEISDEDIKNLNLTELWALNNPKIKNIRHMTNLKRLFCGGNCGISDEDIQNLNLTYLHSIGNPKVTIKI